MNSHDYIVLLMAATLMTTNIVGAALSLARLKRGRNPTTITPHFFVAPGMAVAGFGAASFALTRSKPRNQRFYLHAFPLLKSLRSRDPKSSSESLLQEGLMLMIGDQASAANQLFDLIISEWDSDKEAEGSETVAHAFLFKGIALEAIDRKRALATYDELLRLFGFTPTEAFIQIVATASSLRDELVSDLDNDPR